MAIVNLVNRLGVNATIVASVLTGVNSICQNFNYLNAITIETITPSSGRYKTNDWYKVCQNKILKPCGNEITPVDQDGILSVQSGYLFLDDSVDLPVFNVDEYNSVINDVLATAILLIVKNNLIAHNAHMKTFFMLKALYTDKSTEWTQAYSFHVDGKDYRL